MHCTEIHKRAADALLQNQHVKTPVSDYVKCWKSFISVCIY